MHQIGKFDKDEQINNINMQIKIILLIKMIEILENITFRRFKRYNFGNLKNIIVGNEYKWMIEKILKMNTRINEEIIFKWDKKKW